MGHAPENTLLGVRRALALGVDGIEIDVRLSADGVPVLLHDQLLERTTNGCGPVGAATLEQLKTLDAGGGERIPALAETLAAVAGRALLVVELKTSPGDDVEALSAAVLAEIESAGAMPWCWLWSFDRSAAAALSERAPPNARIAQLCLAPAPRSTKPPPSCGCRASRCTTAPAAPSKPPPAAPTTWPASSGPSTSPQRSSASPP